MSDLYDADILAWSEQQAEQLRRLAASARLNDAALDWPNIIEEIESVGREQLHAVESLLIQALVHMLKAEAWPASAAAPGWQAEARRFRDDAARRFSPSMRQRLDLGRLYSQAFRAMPSAIDGQSPLLVPPSCALTFEELLGRA